MLPVSFQAPAAIIFLVGGLLACFAGYRLFRLVLGIYGFILGALVATSMLGSSSTWALVAAAVVGGLLGAVLLVAAYFVGVALLGAGLGAMLANLIWRGIDGEPHWLAVILLAAAGAFLALKLQRYVIIASTAFGGAWTTIVGALALTGNRTAAEAAAHGNVWLLYPLNPAPGQRWLVVAWVVLGSLGALIQLSVTGREKKKR